MHEKSHKNEITNVNKSSLFCSTFVMFLIFWPLELRKQHGDSVFKHDFYIFSYIEQLRKIPKNFFDKFLLYHTSLREGLDFHKMGYKGRDTKKSRKWGWMPKKGGGRTDRGICEMKNCQKIYLKNVTLFLVRMILPFAQLVSLKYRN